MDAEGLPVWAEGDPVEPWWIVRGYRAWQTAYWATRMPVPSKPSKHRFGRGR